MKLFRPLVHIWYTLIPDLFSIFFQEASKSFMAYFIKVRTVQVPDDVIGKVEGTAGNNIFDNGLYHLCLIFLACRHVFLHDNKKPSKIRIKQFSKAKKVAIPFTHRLFSLLRPFCKVGYFFYDLFIAKNYTRSNVRNDGLILKRMFHQIIGASGNVLRNSLIILRVQVSSKSEVSFPLIKNIIQQCSSKAEKMAITFSAHIILLFFASIIAHVASSQEVTL